MMPKLSVAILALLPLLAHADRDVWEPLPDDIPWPNATLYERISSKPKMPYDPKTGTPCNVWYNNDGAWDCDPVIIYTMTDRSWFFEWNPSIKRGPGFRCKNFTTGQSYCLAVYDPGQPLPADAFETSTTNSTPTDVPTLTDTPTPNGIFTPLPAQPGMVGNCNKFYAVRYDDTCASVSSLFAVSLDNFIKWNGMAGKDCDELTVGNFVCVSAPDEAQPTTLTSTTPTSTSTSATASAANSIQTPQPTQPDMVANCKKFHYIWKGNTCGQVTWYNEITQEQFARWNPKVGIECTGLLSDHYACVGVDGESSTPSATPTPTPDETTPSNSIETPQPTQPNMVANCNKFHYIWKGNNCGQVTWYNDITQEQFARWNPKIGLQCDGLWAEAYACVGVLEDAPTPDETTPSNGIETPQPTQPDMVSNCNKFHYIWKGNTCGQITSYNQISQHDLATWNPQVGEQCTGLWAEAYACVGVLADAPASDKTTTPSNGIETPQPTQPGMVSNCKKFHWVSKGNTCGQITWYNEISQNDFATWNPQIGEQCTGLWADAYACVGVY